MNEEIKTKRIPKGDQKDNDESLSTNDGSSKEGSNPPMDEEEDVEEIPSISKTSEGNF